MAASVRRRIDRLQFGFGDPKCGFRSGTLGIIRRRANVVTQIADFLLDIRAIFGETAVRRKMRLKLIVHLVRRDSFERDYERMPSTPLTQDVLGIPVRKVIIQVVAGRNIAVLVEAAVRNSILQLRGIDTYADFVARHHKAMESARDAD